MRKRFKTNQHRGSNRVFTATVEGEYYASSEGGKSTATIKRYRIQVRIPENVQDKAMSVILNNLLEPSLKKNYPDHIRYRTYEITAMVCDEDPTVTTDNPDFMTRGQLLDYIDNYDLPVKHVLYPELQDLRHAVKYAIEDEEAFEVEQNRREEMRGEILALNYELHDLNPELEYA